MAKTIRKAIKCGIGADNGSVLIGDDSKVRAEKRGEWCTGKKLKPYIKDGNQPGRYKRGTHYKWGHKGHAMANTSMSEKLANANANRSMKKGVRQKAKLDIKRQLETI